LLSYQAMSGFNRTPACGVVTGIAVAMLLVSRALANDNPALLEQEGRQFRVKLTDRF
jgi:hypothetical protein